MKILCWTLSATTLEISMWCTFQRPLYDQALTSWLISQISASVYSHNLSSLLIVPSGQSRTQMQCLLQQGILPTCCWNVCASQLGMRQNMSPSWYVWKNLDTHINERERLSTIAHADLQLALHRLALLLQVWQKALLNNKINMRRKISLTIFLSSFVTKVHLGSI